MGKRTSQSTSSFEPRPRKVRRSLAFNLTRTIAILALGVLVLFLAGGWVYSNEIRSSALRPPTTPQTTYEWTVTASGNALTLKTSKDPADAGHEGFFGIDWTTGYAHTDELISSTVEDGLTVDVRRLLEGETGPDVGQPANTDTYYWRGDPRTAHGYTFHEVRYTSDIGSFPAWHIPGTSDTWAIIVHGKGATLEESLRILPTLMDLDYHVLVIGYRNDFGETRDPSGYHQYGKTEWVDLVAAVTYANEHGAADHVLVGYSYGAGIITSYLTQSPLRNFTKAAILDSPMFSFEDTIDYRASQKNLPVVGFKLPGIVGTFAKSIAAWRFDIDWDATNYLEQTAELHAPMLIFHGTNDTSVPYATSLEMSKLRPDITTLITTDAEHVRSWNLDPAFYDATIKDFLEGLD